MFSSFGVATSLLLLPLLALAPAVSSGSDASPALPPAQYQNSASLYSPWDGCTSYTPSSLTSPGFTGGMEQCGTTSPGLDGVTDFEAVAASVSLPLTLGAGQWEQLELESVSATPLAPAQWKKLAPEGAVAPSTSGEVTALKPEVTATLSDSSAVVKKDMSTGERVNVQFAAPSFKEETGDRLNQVGWLARVDVHVTATAESGKQYELTLSAVTSVQGQSWYDLPEWKQTATDEGVECAEGELCAGGVVYALTASSYSVEDANEYAAEPEPSTEPTAPTTEPSSPASPSAPTKPVEPSKEPTAPTATPPLVSGPTVPVVVPTAPTAPVAPEKPAEPVVEPSAPATPITPANSPAEPARAIPRTPAAPVEPNVQTTGIPEVEAHSSKLLVASGSSADSSMSSPSGKATAEPNKASPAEQLKAVGGPDSLQLSPAQQVQLTLLLLILLYAAAMTVATARRVLAVEEVKKKRLSKPVTLTRAEANQIRNKGEQE